MKTSAPVEQVCTPRGKESLRSEEARPRCVLAESSPRESRRFKRHLCRESSQKERGSRCCTCSCWTFVSKTRHFSCSFNRFKSVMVLFQITCTRAVAQALSDPPQRLSPWPGTAETTSGCRGRWYRGPFPPPPPSKNSQTRFGA